MCKQVRVLCLLAEKMHQFYIFLEDWDHLFHFLLVSSFNRGRSWICGVGVGWYFFTLGKIGQRFTEISTAQMQLLPPLEDRTELQRQEGIEKDLGKGIKSRMWFFLFIGKWSEMIRMSMWTEVPHSSFFFNSGIFFHSLISGFWCFFSTFYWRLIGWRKERRGYLKNDVSR